jgi:hypothetical protein
MSDVMFVEEIGSAISLERFARYTSETRERYDTFVDRTSEDEVAWELNRSLIIDSELNSRIEIDWPRKIYTAGVQRHSNWTPSPAQGKYYVGPHPAPVIPVDRYAEDLGQSKTLFGEEVRKIRIREHRPPLPRIGSEEIEATEEGWFMPLPALEAIQPVVCGSQRPSRIGGPGEVVSHSGLEHWGFPVDVITRVREGSSGSALIETWWCDYRLVELSTLPLNPAVFAPPGDFECVSSLNPRGAQPNRPDDCSKLCRLLSRIWGL